MGPFCVALTFAMSFRNLAKLVMSSPSNGKGSKQPTSIMKSPSSTPSSSFRSPPSNSDRSHRDRDIPEAEEEEGEEEDDESRMDAGESNTGAVSDRTVHKVGVNAIKWRV